MNIENLKLKNDIIICRKVSVIIVSVIVMKEDILIKLLKGCVEIKRILIASINTAKESK